MLQMAGRQMEATGADFLLTGEVLGQRPMSQTKQSLYIVAKNSGYADYILRPLSARLLEPIKAERENKIDRGQLLSISGRGRKDQIRLAEAFGIHRYPPPAGGCLLTDPMFSRRLRELMTQGEDWQIRDFELLKYGRHFRVKTGEKIIVGRNKADNDALMSWVSEEDLLLRMANHPGPCVLIPYGTRATSTKEFAAELCVRYSDAPKDRDEDVICTSRGKTEILTCKAAAKEDCESLII